jgi:hypothetical protein
MVLETCMCSWRVASCRSTEVYKPGQVQVGQTEVEEWCNWEEDNSSSDIKKTA